MLGSTQFFQGLSICILGRCSLQEMDTFLIKSKFVDGVRGPSIAEIHPPVAIMHEKADRLAPIA